MPSPVRVAFVSSHADFGGAERYLELLLQEIEPAWVAGVICLQDGPFAGRLRDQGFPVEVVPVRVSAAVVPALWRLRRALRAARADVVHANGVKAALMASLATRLTRTPVIWVKHDFSWDGRLGRAVGLGCRQIVGVSEVVTETFGPRTRRRVHVVGNGLPEATADPPAGRRALREITGGSGDGPVVLMLGRLHPVKGQLDLLEAATRVLARRPDTRFALVGGTGHLQEAYAERVRARVAELGLTGHVALTGHREDPLDLAAAADVVAVPSGSAGAGPDREGFGLVAIEALSVGTPVVGYAAGALPEVLTEGALLVAPGDVDALADAILRLLEDPVAAAELAERGRQLVQRRYRLEHTVAAMRERYAEAARQTRSTASTS